MKQVIFILIVAMVAVFSSSCNQQIEEERLHRIDSLAVHLNYVEETVAQVDSIMIQNRLNDIKETGEWVYDNITQEIDKEKGLALGDYLRTQKYYLQASGRYNEVRKELSYGKSQLATLREDVKNNFYSEEEFNGYFETEARSIEMLIEASDDLKAKYELSNDRYKKHQPVVKALIDSIKSVIYGSEPLGT